MTGPRRVSRLLGADASLAALVRASERRSRYNDRLREFLDRPLADHVQVARADAGLLVLVADTPAWGHRIRYLAPAILEQLRRDEPSLRDVQITVRPAPDGPSPPRAPPRPAISRSTASLLEEVAGNCGNPELARVLARLGERGR